MRITPERRRLPAVALIALLAAHAVALSAFAAGSPQGDSAVAWPATWTAYTKADSSLIKDAEDEPGISPPGTDISSNGNANPSVYYAADGTHVFFRVRVKADPRDDSKGGFDNAFWLVQVATASDNTLRGVVGLNGKPVSTDYVYVTDAAGDTVTQIYTTPFDGSASQASAGARALADGSGQWFLDWQVPVARLTTASGNTITASTPVKLFFGSSTAANLATISKDYMLGSAVDFTAVAEVTLGAPAASPSPTVAPTAEPTVAPTAEPTAEPTAQPDGADLDTDRTVASPGGVVKATVTGAEPGSSVAFCLRPGDVDLGSFTADEHGTVEVELTIPAGTAAGPYQLCATGTDVDGDAFDLVAALTLVDLPATSTDGGTTGMVLLAGALLAAAAAASADVTRRRSARRA
jgi:hypothetical protein